MKKNTCEMMSTGVPAEDLAVQHVRQGRDRVPVMRMTMGERPLDSMQCDTARYEWISIDVNVIIIVDEIVSECLTKHEPDYRSQKNASAHNFAPGVQFSLRQ
jgi:hypothetical protein